MREGKTSDIRSSIDWKKVRSRIREAGSLIEKGWSPDPGQERAILRARARALAREQEKAGPSEEVEIVEFLLAYERYGVATSCVSEVSPLRDLTPVPCTPPFVAGIINIRGQILSVIDLKKFFGLPEKGLGDLDKVIVLRSETMKFGILADDVLGVRRVPLDDLQPSLPTLTGIREEYLRGITAERLIVLDGTKILSDKRVVVDEQVS